VSVYTRTGNSTVHSCIGNFGIVATCNTAGTYGGSGLVAMTRAAHGPVPRLAHTRAGAELAAKALHVLFGPNNKSQASKMKSRRLKYVTFALEAGALPIMPVTSDNIIRFMMWLPDNNVRSGWKGALSYVTEVANWCQELQFPDPRTAAGPWLWNRFRHNYQRLVVTEHPAMKLPIRPGHLEAMSLDADLSNASDLRDICMYHLLFYAGVRIGHVAPPSTAMAEHTIRFEDVYFEPSIAAPTLVYVCLRSTKTRPRASALPFWVAINAQPQLPFCPVALLREHFVRTWSGRPSDFVFRTPAGNPLPRSTFTSILRARLQHAARRLPGTLNLKKYSGVSFRKGCLSTLGALNVPAHRLADQADHANVASSRGYCVDTMRDRAANSDLIATAFLEKPRL